MVESFVVGIVIVAVVALTLTGVTRWVGVKALYETGVWQPVAGATTVPPTFFDQPEPATPSPVADHSPVAEVAPTAAAPNAAAIKQAINGIDRSGIGGTMHVSVVDLSSGQILYRENAAPNAIPASTIKVLTSVAVLKEYGADHRFTTQVVLVDDTQPTGSPSPSVDPTPASASPSPDRPAPATIILVGGGDPYLSSGALAEGYPAPTISTLAERTADALQAQGIDQVTLGFDDTLFAGPSWNPTWPSNYADQVTPVSALTVDQGRVTGDSPGARVDDPAGVAAATFAQALQAQGITVTGNPARMPAPAQATELAQLDSLPLGQIVEHLMRVSDNDAAEIMFRHVAIARGLPGSFAGGQTAVAQVMTELGAWPAGAVIHDGSGLSRQNLISTDTLASLMAVITTDEPRYRPVMTGMPVGGVDGSLRFRFVVDGTTAGRGLVRAKTGTLTKVHSLAGYVRTADGALVGFAFISNGADDEYGARTWLEKAAAAMAACGCG